MSLKISLKVTSCLKLILFRLSSGSHLIYLPLYEDSLIKDIEDAADFRENARKPRIQATKLLKDVSKFKI